MVIHLISSFISTLLFPYGTTIQNTGGCQVDDGWISKIKRECTSLFLQKWVCVLYISRKCRIFAGYLYVALTNK